MISQVEKSLGYAVKALVDMKGSKADVTENSIAIYTRDGNHYLYTENYSAALVNHLIDIIYPVLK